MLTDEERNESKQNQELFQKMVLAFELDDVEKTREYIKVLVQKRENNPKIRLTQKVLTQILNAAQGKKELLFELIDSLGTPFRIESLKSYPQSTLNPKWKMCLNYLLALDLRVNEIVEVFLNTVMREDITLNHLVRGYARDNAFKENEIINALSNYWIIGEVKKITDDNFLRIAPGNVGMIRLAGVQADTYKISGDDGCFVEPFIGQTLYFKIKKYNYKSDMFTVHYLCTNPSFIEEKVNDKTIK